MPVFIDSLNRKISLEQPPVKIISLVPSITELLFDLNLANNISGITKYCTKPEKKPGKYSNIGGVENINLELIDEMNPDLIFASKEENSKTEIDILAKKYQVFITSVESYDQAINMIFDIGEIINKSKEANQIIKIINENFESFQKPIKLKKVAYLIWKNPYISIGKNTFIHNMLEKAGCYNVFYNSEKYPITNSNEIKQKNPEYVFLSSEPYPFNEKDKKELQKKLPNSKIIFVNGEIFSWYGSRMIFAPEYFKQLF